jgi:hypothetical protein
MFFEVQQSRDMNIMKLRLKFKIQLLKNLRAGGFHHNLPYFYAYILIYSRICLISRKC